MFGLLVAAAFVIGGPVPPEVPPEVRVWFSHEGPDAVSGWGDLSPTGQAVTLTAPVPQFEVNLPRYGLYTRTVEGPTTPDDVLWFNNVYCALVLVGGRPAGGMLCTSWLDVATTSTPGISIEETELRTLPADGFFRVGSGLFTIAGDQVVPLDTRAKVHVPDGTGNAEQFFTILSKREPELDAVQRVEGAGDVYSSYPPLLGPPDATWDALVLTGRAIPEPMHSTEGGTAHQVVMSLLLGSVVAGFAVVVTASAAIVVWLVRVGRRRRSLSEAVSTTHGGPW